MAIILQENKRQNLYFPANFIRTEDAFVLNNLQTQERLTIPNEMVSDGVKNIFPITGQPVKGVKVCTNDNATRLYSISPFSGTFWAVFDKFVSRNGELPSPKFKEGRQGTRRDGTTYPIAAHYTFTALFDVIDGELEGTGIALFMRYQFEPGPDGNIIYTATGRDLKNFADFMQAVGLPLDSVDIRWSENILPSLQSNIQAISKVVKVTLENGWVTSIAEPGAGEEVPTIKQKFTSDSISDDLDSLLMGT